MKNFDVQVRLRNNQLLERREQLGLSQSDLAYAAGLSTYKYAALELMSISPLIAREGDEYRWSMAVSKLADFYDVDPDVLFPEEVLAIKQSGFRVKRDRDELMQLPEVSQTLALLPSDTLTQKELEEKVSEVLSTLTPREEKVLRMRFGIGEKSDSTLEEVARGFGGVHCERIRQIEGKALRKLRNPIRSKKLKEFIDHDPHGEQGS